MSRFSLILDCDCLFTWHIRNGSRPTGRRTPLPRKHQRGAGAEQQLHIELGTMSSAGILSHVYHLTVHCRDGSRVIYPRIVKLLSILNSIMTAQQFDDACLTEEEPVLLSDGGQRSVTSTRDTSR